MGDSKAVDYNSEIRALLDKSGAVENSVSADPMTDAAAELDVNIKLESICLNEPKTVVADAAPAHVFTLDEDF